MVSMSATQTLDFATGSQSCSTTPPTVTLRDAAPLSEISSLVASSVAGSGDALLRERSLRQRVGSLKSRGATLLPGVWSSRSGNRQSREALDRPHWAIDWPVLRLVARIGERRARSANWSLESREGASISPFGRFYWPMERPLGAWLGSVGRWSGLAAIRATKRRSGPPFSGWKQENGVPERPSGS